MANENQITAQELGMELAHVGINTENEETALKVAELFNEILGAGIKNGNSSAFVGTSIEVMKSMYLGTNGHIGFRVNDIEKGIAYMEAKGFAPDMSTAKYKNGKMTAVYFQGEIGGFAFHLVQK